jgi:hypothetical protein
LFLLTCLTLAECLACPCDKDGQYLLPRSHPPPREPLDAAPENPYHPFEDRLAFEFADFHFSEQQSSQRHIDYALELLMAQAAKNHVDDDVPWKLASNMYTTCHSPVLGRRRIAPGVTDSHYRQGGTSEYCNS